MTKIASNNALPLPNPTADKDLADTAPKNNQPSNKTKMVAGGIIGSLALTGLYMTYPHVMNRVSNFGALINPTSTDSSNLPLNNTVLLQKPHVVPTFSDNFLQEAVALAETTDNPLYWEAAGLNYRRVENYTGAHEALTKCSNMGQNLCQSALRDLEQEKNTYTTAALNAALASIKQNLGNASPSLIKAVAQAEKSEDAWSMYLAGSACEKEAKFEQADYWYTRCADKGGAETKVCKQYSNKVRSKANSEAQDEVPTADQEHANPVSDLELKELIVKAIRSREEGHIYNAAKALHDRQEYAKAFSYYNEGARLGSTRCYEALTQLSSQGDYEIDSNELSQITTAYNAAKKNLPKHAA